MVARWNGRIHIASSGVLYESVATPDGLSMRFEVVADPADAEIYRIFNTYCGQRCFCLEVDFSDSYIFVDGLPFGNHDFAYGIKSGLYFGLDHHPRFIDPHLPVAGIATAARLLKLNRTVAAQDHRWIARISGSTARGRF